MKSFVVFLGLLALVWGQSTNVQQCLYQAGAGSLPINTYIAGCTSTPCSFAQGTDVNVELIFRARWQIQGMQTLAWAYILGPIGVPYDLGNDSVTCNFLTNTYCPLQQDEVVIYNLRMHIESWMPAGTSVTIEFVIRDTNGNVAVTCVRVPIAITLPIASRGLDMVNDNSTLTVAAKINNK